MKTYPDENNQTNHDLLIELRTDMKWVKDSINKMQRDIEELKRFRWKFYGAVAGVSAAVSVFVSVIVSIFI